MWKLVSLLSVQSILLVCSQVCLKLALTQFGKFQWTWQFFGKVFSNLHFALSGLSIALASLIWVFVLKKYEFSLAYPLISMSYIFGLLAAYFVFHESIPLTRWIGVVIIMIGVCFVTKG